MAEKRFQYRPQGVCSQLIEFTLDGELITGVAFTGGCDGNLQAVSSLVTGMTVEQAVAKIEGIRCGWKQTSCPDQLAKALRMASEK